MISDMQIYISISSLLLLLIEHMLGLHEESTFTFKPGMQFISHGLLFVIITKGWREGPSTGLPLPKIAAEEEG